MREISLITSALASEKIGVDVAKERTRALREAIKLMRLEFDHANASGRIKAGSPVLPGFVREE